MDPDEELLTLPQAWQRGRLLDRAGGAIWVRLTGPAFPLQFP